jgi:asparagine synthase (glutamine-hydrolysing)
VGRALRYPRRQPFRSRWLQALCSRLVTLPALHFHSLGTNLAGLCRDAEPLLDMLSRLEAEARCSSVDSHLDMAMFATLAYATNDANYRVPDISGLAAQVEVRSPFLDVRMVEFAARLPHQFKIGDPLNPGRNKLLPKLFYERLVPADIAWARKKGMGANLRWNESILADVRFEQAFTEAYSRLDAAGIDAGPCRTAWAQYRRGGSGTPWWPTNLMMNGFMLGAWLGRRLPGAEMPTQQEAPSVPAAGPASADS